MNCMFLAHYKDDKPFFPQSFKYEQKGFSRLLVMRKSDGSFIATVKTKPFFATHQVFIFLVDVCFSRMK